jgi:hypothetical protein
MAAGPLSHLACRPLLSNVLLCPTAGSKVTGCPCMVLKRGMETRVGLSRLGLC